MIQPSVRGSRSNRWKVDPPSLFPWCGFLKVYIGQTFGDVLFLPKAPNPHCRQVVPVSFGPQTCINEFTPLFISFFCYSLSTPASFRYPVGRISARLAGRPLRMFWPRNSLFPLSNFFFSLPPPFSDRRSLEKDLARTFPPPPLSQSPQGVIPG